MADQMHSLTEVDTKEENLVEYYIFPSKKLISCDNLTNEVFAFLNTKCQLGKYIWQCESFNLKRFSETALLPDHLYGSTYYGDNIEDEWFIVYMLLELSKKYEDFIVRIVDEDGEFLLIEAADNLPTWLQPDVAENRVYIHNGGIHIVEHDRSCEAMSVRDALSHIASFPQDTLASMKIQGDIFRRFAGYPEKISEMKHFTNCYIPANLSVLLSINPCLISLIVQAFYERDDLDLKHCVTFKYFQPGTRVNKRVQMTRCQYAQLMQQKFNPEPRSGYTLPHMNSQKYKAHDLGAKLAHGAEILCRNARSSYQITLPSCDSKWLRFHKSLIADGYFKDELEGSKVYNELLSTAKAFYMTSIAPYLYDETISQNSMSERSSETESTAPSCQPIRGDIGRDQAGSLMLSLMKDLEVNIEVLRKEAEHMDASDDDGWMDIGPEELDEKLSRYSRKAGEDAIGVIPKKVKSFVGQKSGHLGVELPESGDSEIFFEPETFMATLQKVFDFEDPKSSSSDSDLDEYDSESDSGEEGMTMPGMDPSRLEGASLRTFMDMMDHELSSTKVGRSFVSHSEVDSSNISNNLASAPKTSWATWDKMSNNVKMDASRGTKFSASKDGNKSKEHTHKTDDDDDDDDCYSEDDGDFKPVDVDMNLVQNLLKSYSAQQGLAGPSSVILNSLGLNLPPPDDDEEEDNEDDAS